jgi:hypothetical protein
MNKPEDGRMALQNIGIPPHKPETHDMNLYCHEI